MNVRSLSHRVAVTAIALVVSTGAFAETQVAAGPSELSVRASELSVATLSTATGVLVSGSLSAVGLSGQAVISGLEVVGDSVVVTLQASGNAAEASVRLSGVALESVGMVVGGTVMLSAYATGTVIYTAGQLIGFIPNDRGRALIRSQRVGPRPIA